MIEALKRNLLPRGIGKLLSGSKWVSGGAILTDPDGKILLVKSRLRNSWEYPAGGSTGRESPLEACRREVEEETGLNPAAYRMIGVDFFHMHTPNGNLLFTFAADVSHEEAEGIKIDKFELMDSRWVTRAEALTLIAPRLHDRFEQLLKALDDERPVYLHTGHSVV